MALVALAIFAGAAFTGTSLNTALQSLGDRFSSIAASF